MPPSPQRVQVAVLVLACAGAIGCHHTTAQAAAPTNETPAAGSPQPAPAKPAAPEAGAAPAPANPTPAKPTSESASAPSPAPKPTESKPHPANPPAAPPAETPAPAPKPAPPQITLRMSPAEEAELKSQTQKSIAEAEANLRKTSGHDLNDAQRDMVEKIQSFLAQSREASEFPDWSRARILAEKARLLSIELANSL